MSLGLGWRLGLFISTCHPCPSVELILLFSGLPSNQQIIKHPQNLEIKSQKIMKLTTTTQQKSKNDRPISNVFKLKQMIQKAASGQYMDDKQNMRGNVVNTLPDLDYITLGYKSGKVDKNGDYNECKTYRSKSEISQPEEKDKKHLKLQLTNLNFGKLKIHPVMASSVKTISNVEHKNKPTNFLVKSKSNKTISNKKIQGLSKSFRYSAPTIQQSLSIDSFNLGRKLGKGRFGNVYAAQQKHTNFLLAIKVVNKKQLKQSEMQQQLLSQIKLQLYMRHPNILKMYGYFHDELNIYLMLQLADECLFKDLRRKTCFSQKQVAYYTKQIIEGLKYMHNENIIHRDLKPENIMVVNNVIKLADFGWSVYSPLYKRQTFCGTLDYVPPEIVKGDFYDQRVDVWSLGILVFQLTFGYAPFEGSNSEQQTFERIINGQYQIPGHISDQLRRIIKYILIGDPRMRLNLVDIEQSNWLRAYEKQGRSISEDIWDFWQSKRAC